VNAQSAYRRRSLSAVQLAQLDDVAVGDRGSGTSFVRGVRRTGIPQNRSQRCAS
jgi:hypothetical protein